MRAIIRGGVQGSGANLLTQFVLIDDSVSPEFNYGNQGISVPLANVHSKSDYRTEVVAAMNAYCTANSVAVPSTYFWEQDGETVDYNTLINKPTIPAPSYSTYQALVSQTGTAAPTATTFVNDFGTTTFTWARTGAGTFTVTASAATFTSGKTAVFVKPLDNLNGAIKAIVTSTTVITITTAIQSLAILGLLGFTATPTDSMLIGTALEVRVYP